MIRGPLGIAGIGLIGGSIAQRARLVDPGIVIRGVDRDRAALNAALDGGTIDETVADVAVLADGCATLVIALPVDATVDALHALRGRSGPELIVDVASVKQVPVAAGAGVANYIGTHPMAGRERGGIAASDPKLFVHATWAYVPHADTALVARACAFIAAMGACPLELDAARHDAIVALTSHLPQSLSILLGAQIAAGALGDPDVLSMCGPGIASMLRLARSPEAVWSPIVAANAGPLGDRLHELAALIERIADHLTAGDSEPLMSYFKAAHDIAAALEQRFAPEPRS